MISGSHHRADLRNDENPKHSVQSVQAAVLNHQKFVRSLYSPADSSIDTELPV